MNKKLAIALPFLLISLVSMPALAQSTPNGPFQHIIIIVQENRTPDNLFQDNVLIDNGADINTGADLAGESTPKPTNCNITGGGSYTEPMQPWAHLNDCFNPDHSHKYAFETTFDSGSWDGACNIMVADATCYTDYNPGYYPNFTYVKNYYDSGSSGPKILDPYFNIAKYYGFANYMFQTNQGPSYVAHQFLFSGTSGPVYYDADGYHFDKMYAAENPLYGVTGDWSLATDVGCTAPWEFDESATTTVEDDVDSTNGDEGAYYYPPGYSAYVGFPCYNHTSLGDLIDAGLGTNEWKYYIQDSSYDNNIWTAPNSLSPICPFDPNTSGGCSDDSGGNGQWSNVEDTMGQVLTDISDCDLQPVSWVIPDGTWSDHPGGSGFGDGGPSWVAAIVNAIGGSDANGDHPYACYDTENMNYNKYWTTEPTAILVVWDDWGGWYDHVTPYQPTGLNEGYGNKSGLDTSAAADGDYYVYGARVPLLVISTYNNHCASPMTCSDGFTGYISGNIMTGDYNQGEAQPYIHDFGSILGFVEWNFGLSPYDGGSSCGIAGTESGGCGYPYADYLAPDGYYECSYDSNCGEGDSVQAYPLWDFFNVNGFDNQNSFMAIAGAKYAPDCFVTPATSGCFGEDFTVSDPDVELDPD